MRGRRSISSASRPGFPSSGATISISLMAFSTASSTTLRTSSGDTLLPSFGAGIAETAVLTASSIIGLTSSIVTLWPSFGTGSSDIALTVASSISCCISSIDTLSPSFPGSTFTRSAAFSAMPCVSTTGIAAIDSAILSFIIFIASEIASDISALIVLATLSTYPRTTGANAFAAASTSRVFNG